MLNFKFILKNPFIFNIKKELFNFSLDRRLSKWKNFEFQFSSFSGEVDTLIEVIFNISFTGEDHAGPQFQLVLGPLFINIKFYDSRHWNYDENCWETYP